MLYTDTAVSEGFGIASDVNVILIQDTTSADWDIIEEYTGSDGTQVQDAIDDMYRNGFNGELAAVIEDGRATSIIIHNTNKKPIDTGTTTPTVSSYQVIVSDEANDYQDAQIFAPTNAASWSISQALNALAARIQADGNTLVEIDTTSGGSITWLDASMGDARKVTALPNNRVYRVELNGEYRYLPENAIVADATYVTGQTIAWDVDWTGEYFLDNRGVAAAENSTSSWYRVQRTNANSNGVITLEDGLYDVTITNGVSTKTLTANGTNITTSGTTVYVTPGEELTLVMVGGNYNGGTGWTLTTGAGSNYAISDRVVSTTSTTDDTITVTLTVPTTNLATDNTVTITEASL